MARRSMAANATDCYMKQELALVDTGCNKLKQQRQKDFVETLKKTEQNNRK